MNLVNSRRVIIKWKELKLKPKEIKFLAEYIQNGFNGTNAYLKTIAKKNTSYTSAGSEASQLLKRPNIKKAMNEWMESFLETVKTQLEAQIIRQLMARAFYDVSDYYNNNGTLKQLTELTKDQRMAIDSMDRKYHGKNDIEVLSYKLADKDKARQELENYIDLIKQSVDINIKSDLDKKTSELIDNAIEQYKIHKQLKA